MPRIESRSLVWASAAFLGLWVILGQGQEAAANLGYRLRWETDENDAGRLLQLYDHRLNLNLAQDLTDRLSAAEDINYNYRWQQEGGRTETVSPRASLALNGDIFRAGLAVNSLRNLNSQSSQSDSDTLGITWATTWVKKLVPTLRANYDNSRRTRDVDNRLIEDVRQGIGGEVDWNLQVAQVFYSYKRDTSKYQYYETSQDAHLAKVSAGRAWLDNRLRVSLGHEYSETRDERLVNFNSQTTANLPANPTQVRTGSDTPPDDSIEPPALSVPNIAMRDGLLLPTDPSAYTVVAGSSDNCIVLVNSTGQQMDHLYLYTQVIPSASGLTWWVYSNNTFGTTAWTPVTGVPNPTYDPVSQRFDMVLPALTAPYVKIVIRNNSTANIDFTEVQVDQVLHSAVGSTLSLASKAVNNKSNFSLDYKLNRAAAFSYSLLMVKNDMDGDTLSENENHNSSLRLQNSAGDLRSNLSFNLSRSRYKASPEIETKAYQLGVNKVFLPTLSAALGASREESSQSGSVLYDRNRYTFYADARLYPDLNSRLDVTYWEQESYHSTGGSSVSDSLRSLFVISSRFSPALNVSLSEVYEVMNQGNQPRNQLNSHGLSGNWQLSAWLTLSGSVMLTQDSKLVQDTYSYMAGMVVGLAAGLELTGNYSRQEAAVTSQSGLATLRWSSKRNVSWEVGCNYVESEAGGIPNEYKVYSRLLVNFVTN